MNTVKGNIQDVYCQLKTAEDIKTQQEWDCMNFNEEELCNKRNSNTGLEYTIFDSEQRSRNKISVKEANAAYEFC